MEVRAESGPRSWRRLSLGVLGALLALYVLASLAWPHTITRLVLLPRPGAESWYDGCNWHGRRYERSAIFWTYIEDSTARACPPGGTPEDDA